MLKIQFCITETNLILQYIQLLTFQLTFHTVVAFILFLLNKCSLKNKVLKK